jgi:anti-anti-sigma factor
MFHAHRPLWYVWPARPADSDSHILAAKSTPHALRPAVTTTVVEVTASQSQDDLNIRIKGELKAQCAGMLLDALLTATARRPAVVTLDLSELRSISSLAIGVLVTYRRGVVRRGGRVRLVRTLRSDVKEALTRADLLDLFETTAAVDVSSNHHVDPAHSKVKAAS